MVSVVKAEGLLAKDKGGTSDPYVELRVGKEVKAKTKIIEKTLNPEWNESFEVDLGQQDTLDVVCYDHDKGMLIGSFSEFLGCVSIPFAQIDSGTNLSEWLSDLHLPRLSHICRHEPMCSTRPSPLLTHAA